MIESCRVAANYFDHLVIRNYPLDTGFDRAEELQRMVGCALKGGWDSSQISAIEDSDEGTQAILSMAKEGDCLVMTYGMGEIETMWAAITSFQPALQ